LEVFRRHEKNIVETVQELGMAMEIFLLSLNRELHQNQSPKVHHKEIAMFSIAILLHLGCQ